MTKRCEKCSSEMDARGVTPPYMDCNTWVCPKCEHVEPELASGKIRESEREE
jgi:hypothetical protein